LIVQINFIGSRKSQQKLINFYRPKSADENYGANFRRRGGGPIEVKIKIIIGQRWTNESYGANFRQSMAGGS
jgi:hypothetical protein